MNNPAFITFKLKHLRSLKIIIKPLKRLMFNSECLFSTKNKTVV